MSEIESGPLVLRAASSRVAKAVGSLFFAAFWNGIVSIFVVHLVRGAMRNSFEWFLACFLIPFVLIGLGLIAFFVHSFLGLFAPRLMVTLSTRRICLGDAIGLEWQFSGRVHSVRSLRIFVEGSEEATYRRGTSTSTDRHVFARIDIFKAIDPNQIGSGQAQLRLPNDSMPTFSARNNKLVWTLRVRGDIPRFPDINDSFVLDVLPARNGRGGA